MNTQLQAAIDWALSTDCFSDLARDIAQKSSRWTLSPKQEAVLLKIHGGVLAREAERQARVRAGVSAPIGRVPVVGQVTRVFTEESAYGTVTKVCVDLTTGAKVRGNAPGKATPAIGQRVSFTATFTASQRDLTVGYWSRAKDWEVK